MNINDINCINGINGLYYFKFDDIIVPDIVSKLDEYKWTPLTNSVNSRIVQHYGYKYNYLTYNIKEKTDPFPDFLNPYVDKLYNLTSRMNLIPENYKFNQCIVNNYSVGQGISKHIDVKSYGNVIGCFTINSGATMIFRHLDKSINLYVEPNSLYIMSGEARYLWSHEMTTNKYDKINDTMNKRDRRISITFRNVP